MSALRIEPKGAQERVTPRTRYSMTFESSGKENNPAIAEDNEDVSVVVVSFAKSPFRPAARPLPIARCIQLAVIVDVIVIVSAGVP